MQNFYYKHPFLWILNFHTFLSSFLSCFPHIGTAWIMCSLLTSSNSISAGQNRPRALWGEPHKNEYRDMNEGWWPLLLITHVLKWGHIPLPFCVFTTLRFAITIEDKLISGI